MQYLSLHEKARHGTPDLPFEFHHVDHHHPRYIMDYHWHAEYELIRVLRGSLDMTLDEKQLTAESGSLIFVQGGALHSGTPHDCVYECLIFDIHLFMKYAPSCAPYIQRIISHTIRIQDCFPNGHPICTVTDPVFAAMSSRKKGYELLTCGGLYSFFGEIFAQHLYTEVLPAPRKGYRRILQLKNVVDYIDRNYASQITLQQLSSAASMSPKYFCRFFHQMTHRTPMDYLNYRRIEQACYELSTTENSVTEIALNCGFNDLSYFIKTFKKYKHITPGKYKTG